MNWKCDVFNIARWKNYFHAIEICSEVATLVSYSPILNQSLLYPMLTLTTCKIHSTLL